MMNAPSMTAPSVGAMLKAERAKRGVHLDDVAASTKIPRSLLEALERDDLSRWPKGVYRRSFFRAYVSALGLAPDPLTAEFLRLFPDEAPEATAGSPRRMAVSTPHPVSEAAPAVAGRLGAALLAVLELLLVVAAGAAIAWWWTMPLLWGSGTAALAYYPVVRAISAHGLRSWQMTGRAALAIGRTRMPQFPSHAVEYCRPFARRGMTAVRHAGVQSGRAVARTARSGGRASARALAAVSYHFWRGVRAAAAHAEVLASKQLSRTPE
jgi:hypothetical protein